MTLEIEHKGEKIVFYESDETWNWNGREYAKPSSAKAAIDRSLRVDFEKLSALFEDYNGIKRVTVTSLAETGYAWIVNAEGKRSKELLKRLFADSQVNADLLTQMAKKGDEIGKIRDEIRELNSRMELLVIPTK